MSSNIPIPALGIESPFPIFPKSGLAKRGVPKGDRIDNHCKYLVSFLTFTYWKYILLSKGRALPKKRSLLPLLSSFALLLTASISTPSAIAQNLAPKETSPGNQIIHTEEPAEFPTTSTRSAHTVEIAPGASGAFVAQDVQGHGLYVDRINASYMPGASLQGQNICGITLETSYTENNGRHRVRSATPPCSVFTAWVNFPVKKLLRDKSEVCSRVKVNGVWSNKTCATIHK